MKRNRNRGAALLLASILTITTCLGGWPDIRASAQEIESAAAESATDQDTPSGIASGSEDIISKVETDEAESVGLQDEEADDEDINNITDEIPTDYEDSEAEEEIINAEDPDSALDVETETEAVEESSLTEQIAETSDEDLATQSKDLYPEFHSTESADNGVTVTAYAKTGVLPMGTVMTVKAISSGVSSNGDDALQSVIEDKLNDRVVVDFIAVDISFSYQGNEIEPDGNVSITLDTPHKIEGDATVWHVDDSMNATCVDNASVGESDASFSASDFSVYAIIGTEDKKNTRTYHFYNGSDLIYSQAVKNGDTLVAPENPVCKEDPGKPFKGWSSDGGNTFLSFSNLKREITDIGENEEEVNLQAIFDDAHTVTFFSPNGNIVTEETVSDGTVIDPSEVKCEIEEGDYINSWTQDPDYDWSQATAVVGETSVTVDQDISFYPIVKGVTWVFFNGNAGSDETTYIEPTAVKNGDKLVKPEDPSRRGYTFSCWTTDRENEEVYNFDDLVPSSQNGVLNLYANWNPASTTYTIEIWVEACKDGQYVESPKNYKKKYSFTVEGNTGETLDPEVVRKQATEKENEYIANYTDKRGDSESLQYRDINTNTSDEKNKGVVIKGDGSTTAYVYYDMRTYRFDFQPGDRYGTFTSNHDWIVTFEADGKTYTYSFDKKWHADGTLTVVLHPGEYTSSLPQNIIATNTKTGETRKALGLFTFWLEQWNQNNLTYHDNTLYTLPDFQDGLSYVPMFLYWPKSVDRQNRWSNVAFTSNMADFTIHYLYETQQSGTYIQETETYSNPAWYNWGPQTARGFKAMEPDEVPDTLKEQFHTFNDDGQDLTVYQKGNSSHEYYFFFKRMAYNLSFYNDGELLRSYTNDDMEAADHKIKYQANISDLLFTPKMPEKYKSGDYIFEGWSTQGPDGPVITGTTMPASDVKLYAVWKAKDVTVTMDANGGSFADGSSDKSLTLSPGNKITEQEEPTREGYRFLGWAEEGGLLFTTDTLLYHDTNLVARWVKDGSISIQYDDGYGNITDSGKRYSEAAFAKVNYTPKQIPDSKLFVGWEYDGVTYVNGQTIMVRSKNAKKATDTESNYTITLKAVYTDALSKLSISYHPNGGEGGKTYYYAKYASFSVANADEAGVARTGYRLIGWNTKQDGSGTNFTIGATAALDELSPFPNVLYAMWDKNTQTQTDDTKKTENGGSTTETPAPIATTSVQVVDKENDAVSVENAANGSASNATEFTAPQTGDSSHIGLWLMIMLAALAGVIGTAAYRRKHR